MIQEDENIWKINKKNCILHSNKLNANCNKYYGVVTVISLLDYKMENFYNYYLKQQIAKKFN